MAQQATTFDAKPEDLSSILEIHMMEGEDWLLKVVL